MLNSFIRGLEAHLLVQALIFIPQNTERRLFPTTEVSSNQSSLEKKQRKSLK